MPWQTFDSAGSLITKPGLPTYVTSLPSSPADGTEVYYAADATNGVIWHLRYRSASSSSYKWEFVGGPPVTLLDSSLANSSITGGTWGDISTELAVTVPLAGDYEVRWSIETARSDGAQAGYAGIKVDTTDPTHTVNTTYANTLQDIWSTHSQTRIITGIGASKKLSIRYRPTSTSTMYRLGASMAVVPVRVA